MQDSPQQSRLEVNNHKLTTFDQRYKKVSHHDMLNQRNQAVAEVRVHCNITVSCYVYDIHFMSSKFSPVLSVSWSAASKS